MEYLLPILFSILMLISLTYTIAFFIKQNPKQKYDTITWKDILIVRQYLRLCTPRQFEIFTAMLFSLRGFNATVTPESNDYGRDCIISHMDGTETLIECKLYDAEKTSSVSRPIAQKLAGSMWHEQKRIKNNVHGMIFTTGNITNEAYEYCKFMNIDIYDTERIIDIVEEIGTSQVLLACEITPNYKVSKEQKFVNEVYEV